MNDYIELPKDIIRNVLDYANLEKVRLIDHPAQGAADETGVTWAAVEMPSHLIDPFWYVISTEAKAAGRFEEFIKAVRDHVEHGSGDDEGSLLLSFPGFRWMEPAGSGGGWESGSSEWDEDSPPVSADAATYSTSDVESAVGLIDKFEQDMNHGFIALEQMHDRVIKLFSEVRGALRARARL